MFEEKMVPNGVGTGSPPAKFLPPRTVWQSLQLPIAANSRPRLTSAASKLCGLNGSIAAMADRQATANAAAAPPSSSTTRAPPMIVFFFIRPSGFFRFLAQSQHLAEPPNPAHRLLMFLLCNNGDFRKHGNQGPFQLWGS